MYTSGRGFSSLYSIILDFLWLFPLVSPFLQVQIVVGILFWSLGKRREKIAHDIM